MQQVATESLGSPKSIPQEQPDVLAQKPELVFQKPHMQQQLVREKHPILHQQAAKPQVHAPAGCKAAGSIAEQPIKRLINTAKRALLEETRKINQQLIDTVVVICDEHTISTAAATGCGGGTIVMCSFTAGATCPNFKSGLVSALASPIQPLKLIVPANYPHTSPNLLDKMPVAREDHQDLSVKVISKLNSSLGTLSKPFSVGDIARMWDFCVQMAVLEYALQNGGGNFSSKYGTWETCLGAA